MLGEKGGERDGDVMVLCGVDFMGERGKILGGKKRVIIGDEGGGWGMGDMVKVEGVG
ncbi:quinolinate synthase NadA, partial [Paenibacillus xylanexedens]|uniref:quinolinate synthase NadA n=1 Tax=Paenibacillus xylanexedens TaxID=528191 RepID=UPI001642CDAB